MHPARSIAVLLAAIAAAASAHAQTVWRCADGYSQQPCAGGTSLPPAPAPATSVRPAESVGARDQRLADSLERDRLKREAQAQAAPSLHVPAPAEPMEGYKTPEKKATRKLDVFTASVPGSGKQAKPAGNDKGKAGNSKADPGNAAPVALGNAPAKAKDGGSKPAKKKAKDKA